MCIRDRICLVTTIVAAYIPAYKAIHKSAIEAIRQSDEIIIKPNEVKTSKLTQKLFGFAGVMATKNFKRNKRKYHSTILSLALSVILFKMCIRDRRNTVQKNVLSGKLGTYSTLKSTLGLFSNEDYQLCNEVIAKVGLENKLHSRCDELSGGQQQRVSIARTLFQEATIILADEPVASLDPVTSKKTLSDLKDINEQLGITVIVNIHSVELAKAFATKIIALQDGKLVFEGTPEELTDEKLNYIYKGISNLEEEVQDED